MVREKKRYEETKGYGVEVVKKYRRIINEKGKDR